MEAWQYQLALAGLTFIGTLLGVLWRMQVATTEKDVKATKEAAERDVKTTRDAAEKDAREAKEALRAQAAAQDKEMVHASQQWREERGRIWTAIEEDRLDRQRMKDTAQALALQLKDCVVRDWHTQQMARMEDNFNRQTEDLKHAMNIQFEKLEKSIHEIDRQRVGNAKS